MSIPLAVFADSDVVISSLLSEKGAAYFLFKEKNISYFISDISYTELTRVCKRMAIVKGKLDILVKKHLRLVHLSTSLTQAKETYKAYVMDLNDAHIVAGAVTAKARFLLSYNLRHFRTDAIKRDFNMIVYPPASFLQYLRSLA